MLIGKDLVHFPSLSDEWHPVLNGILAPNRVTATSKETPACAGGLVDLIPSKFLSSGVRKGGYMRRLLIPVVLLVCVIGCKTDKDKTSDPRGDKTSDPPGVEWRVQYDVAKKLHDRGRYRQGIKNAKEALNIAEAKLPWTARRWVGLRGPSKCRCARSL